VAALFARSKINLSKGFGITYSCGPIVPCRRAGAVSADQCGEGIRFSRL
jgi:hypothetical protein